MGTAAFKSPFDEKRTERIAMSAGPTLKRAVARLCRIENRSESDLAHLLLYTTVLGHPALGDMVDALVGEANGETHTSRASVKAFSHKGRG